MTIKLAKNFTARDNTTNLATNDGTEECCIYNIINNIVNEQFYDLKFKSGMRA